MSNNISEKLEYLDETKDAIKDALIAKGQTISENDTFRSYANAISNIPGTDTSDATATASDIVYDKTAYVNGTKLTGNISPFIEGTYIQGDSAREIDTPASGKGLALKKNSWSMDEVIRTGTAVELTVLDNVVASAIGLTAAKLKAGETVLNVSGTFTSDATATNNDILSGKTAYVNGSEVLGAIPVYTGSTQYTQDIFSTFMHDSANSRIVTSAMIEDGAFKNGFIHLRVADSIVANELELTSSMIKSGESILGVGGKSSVVDTDDANATSSEIVYGKTAYVNGIKLTGTGYKAEIELTQAQYDNLPSPDANTLYIITGA